MAVKRGKKPQTKRQQALAVALRCQIARGKRIAHLEWFGDDLAKRCGYKTHHGMDAIYFYLVQKYNWLPGQVRALSEDDLLFLLGDELDVWTLPADLRDVEPADRD